MNCATDKDLCSLLPNCLANKNIPSITIVSEFPESLKRLINECGSNREHTWYLAIQKALDNGFKSIIETGCYRGTQADGCSTVILGELAKHVNAVCASYELSLANIEIARNELKKRNLEDFVWFKDGDSVVSLAERETEIDFAYLDSFDCGLGPDYSPCQKHQLAELEAILPIMSENAVVLMDDNKKDGCGKTDLSSARLSSLKWAKDADDVHLMFSTRNSKRVVPHRFAVLTGHLGNYSILARKTLYENRAQYCLRHGYDLRILRTIPSAFYCTESHSFGYTWGRLSEMLRLLKTNAYEWVWCVGVDTLVTNMTCKLEDLVWQFGKGKSLLVCGEAVSPVQADSFLVKCDDAGIGYLEFILSTYKDYKTHIWVENQSMNDFRDRFSEITSYVPQHRMNSYDYRLFHYLGDIYKKGLDCRGNRGQWMDGDFMIHWPAQSLSKRLELCELYWPKVIK